EATTALLMPVLSVMMTTRPLPLMTLAAPAAAALPLLLGTVSLLAAALAGSLAPSLFLPAALTAWLPFSPALLLLVLPEVLLEPLADFAFALSPCFISVLN